MEIEHAFEVKKVAFRERKSTEVGKLQFVLIPEWGFTVEMKSIFDGKFPGPSAKPILCGVH